MSVPVTLHKLCKQAHALALEYAFSLHDAEDIAQIVLLNLVRQPYASTAALRCPAYLKAAIRNTACDFYRKEAFRNRLLYSNLAYNTVTALAEVCEETVVYLPVDKKDDIAMRDQLTIASEALRKLSPSHREVLTLLADGFSYKEIAECKAIPINTVRSRIHNARRQLKLLMPQ